jgi:hypothetical protein
MNTVAFYNHYGIGDLFESREFVLEWMRILKVSEATYHCRYPAVFEDLPQIKTAPLTPDLNMRTPVLRRGKHFVVNTWIGALNGETKPRGDYVIWPGVGCTVENIYRMHNDYLRMVGLPRLSRSIADYLPTIDYSRINPTQYEAVNRFVAVKPPQMILIANGNTGSGHAANFDMLEMLRSIPPDPARLFIFSERRETERPDVFFTDDITGRKPGETDVLAISLLSTFCDLIVGRCSGAQMPCETRDNWMDPSKTLLSFTEHDNGASFVRDPVALGLKMRRVHSNATTPEAAAAILQKVLFP